MLFHTGKKKTLFIIPDEENAFERIYSTSGAEEEWGQKVDRNDVGEQIKGWETNYFCVCAIVTGKKKRCKWIVNVQGKKKLDGG